MPATKVTSMTVAWRSAIFRPPHEKRAEEFSVIFIFWMQYKSKLQKNIQTKESESNDVSTKLDDLTTANNKFYNLWTDPISIWPAPKCHLLEKFNLYHLLCINLHQSWRWIMQNPEFNCLRGQVEVQPAFFFLLTQSKTQTQHFYTFYWIDFQKKLTFQFEDSKI